MFLFSKPDTSASWPRFRECLPFMALPFQDNLSFSAVSLMKSAESCQPLSLPTITPAIELKNIGDACEPVALNNDRNSAVQEAPAGR